MADKEVIAGQLGIEMVLLSSCEHANTEASQHYLFHLNEVVVHCNDCGRYWINGKEVIEEKRQNG